MTTQSSEIVSAAILDLSRFHVDAVEDVLNLLTSWARRDELTVMDVRTIVAHYRTAPAPTTTPALAVRAVPLLTETDPPPVGAVRGKDCDGDDWYAKRGGRWRLGSDGMVRNTKTVVGVWGPIDWYDADDNLVGRSVAR